MILHELIDQMGVNVLDYLDRDADVPVLAGIQRQGDLIILPAEAVLGDLVKPEGVAVIRGEAGGNTHLLLADGEVRWQPTTGQTLGHVTVADGAVAYMAHPEHGYMGIAPGSYVIRRQREMADTIRMVAD